MGMTARSLTGRSMLELAGVAMLVLSGAGSADCVCGAALSGQSLGSFLLAQDAEQPGALDTAESYGQRSPDGWLAPRQLNDQAAAQVRIRLETTDLGGAPISQIGVNQSFLLRAFVQDIRAGAAMPGVGAAYVDVTFEPLLATLSGAISHAPTYTNAVSGDTALPGALNEVGGLQNVLFPLGPGEVLLFSVPFQASSIGTIHFVSDPADNLPFNYIVVAEPPSVVPVSDVTYGATSLVVKVPEPSTLALTVPVLAALAVSVRSRRPRLRQGTR